MPFLQMFKYSLQAIQDDRKLIVIVSGRSRGNHVSAIDSHDSFHVPIITTAPMATRLKLIQKLF